MNKQGTPRCVNIHSHCPERARPSFFTFMHEPLRRWHSIRGYPNEANAGGVRPLLSPFPLMLSVHPHTPGSTYLLGTHTWRLWDGHTESEAGTAKTSLGTLHFTSCLVRQTALPGKGGIRASPLPSSFAASFRLVMVLLKAGENRVCSCEAISPPLPHTHRHTRQQHKIIQTMLLSLSSSCVPETPCYHRGYR